MKNLFYLSVCYLTSFVSVQDKITTHLIVKSTSSVTIKGKTSVNKFECNIEKYTGTDTLLLTAERGKGATFIRGLVKLNAAEFDCGMNLMTKDFAEIIQSDKYQYIKINFKSLERIPKFETTEEKFMTKLVVTLGNVAVPCEVRCGIVKDEKGLIHFRGKHTFTFSDFNLEPPTKMMGLIKVDEEITVDFHLIMSMK